MINTYNLSSFISESFLDYPDNFSLCVVFYMPGCDRNCLDCQNKELQDFQVYDGIEKFSEIILGFCKRAKTNKLCLQGGDPLFKHNLFLTKHLLDELSSQLDICIYTGAEKNEIEGSGLKGFKFIKGGRFIKDLYIGSEKTDKYMQFASKNQFLLDSNFNVISKDGIYYF